MMRCFPASVLSAFSVIVALWAWPAGASAALTAAVTVEPSGSGSRIVVVLSNDAVLPKTKRPTKVSVSAKGRVYPLAKVKGQGSRAAVSVGAWRSAVLKGKRQAAARALVGRKVSVAVTSRSGRRTLKATAALPAPGGGAPAPGTTPAPGATPAPAPGGSTSLFGTPAAALTGVEAATALEPFLTDSRFTDCVAGWPSCAVEHRYSHFANRDHYYCRLTSTSGSDINAYASNLTVTGADQATTGAWAISYAVLSYGSVVNYRWDVTPQGGATGQYWGPGVDTAGAATEIITGLTWARGAKTCAY